MSQSEVLNDVLGLVDALIDDRDAVVEGLNAEIDRVQTRFTVLSAIRDSLLNEPEPELDINEPELPLADPDPVSPVRQAGVDVESAIVQLVSKHGPCSPKAIYAAIGVHPTKIGRIVSQSTQLAKDGKLIVLRLS
jgi:hypothetical protein